MKTLLIYIFFIFSPQDVAYHAFAALLYLSASVLLALITILYSLASGSINYKLNIAAVVSPSIAKN